MKYTTFKVWPDHTFTVSEVVLLKPMGKYPAGSAFKSADLNVWEMTLTLKGSDPDFVVDLRFEAED
jgi:hypothetical protein